MTVPFCNLKLKISIFQEESLQNVVSSDLEPLGYTDLDQSFFYSLFFPKVDILQVKICMRIFPVYVVKH